MHGFLLLHVTFVSGSYIERTNREFWRFCRRSSKAVLIMQHRIAAKKIHTKLLSLESCN